jgi:hypothetical protein
LFRRHALTKPSIQNGAVGLWQEKDMAALVPPFTRETATAKVRMAEDGWNSRDPKGRSLNS